MTAISKSAILGLLCLGVAAASISVTPGTISYTIHAGPTPPIGRNYIPQKNQTVTVTASGAWSVTQIGTISTTCRYGGTCFFLSGEFNATPVTTGSAGTTQVWLNWGQGGPSDPITWVSAGSFSGQLDFTDGTNHAYVTVSITVSDNTVALAVTDMKRTSAATAAGCSVQLPVFSGVPPTGLGTLPYFTYSNICPITSEAPVAALPSVLQPAVGATYVDPQFGATVQRVAGPGVIFEYGGISAFTSDDTYVVANTGVYRIADSALFRAVALYQWNIANTYPSPSDDNVLYGTNGSRLQKYNIATNTLSTLVEYNAAPYWIRELYEGGSQGLSEDGWQGFYDRGASASSFTSMSTSVGSKTFVINSGSYAVGTDLTIVCEASDCPGRMRGLVTASTGTSITVNITSVTGSVTNSVWSVARTYPYICAVNIVRIDTTDHAANDSNTYCATWSPSQSPGYTSAPNVDWIQVLDIDRPTGNRYVWMSGQITPNGGGNTRAGSTVFKLGAAGSGLLTQDFVAPEAPQRPVNNDNGILETDEVGLSSQSYTHVTGCVDADGQAWMFGNVDDIYKGNEYALARLSAGKQMMLPVESGGGLRMLEISNWDIQPGCSSRAHMWAVAPLASMYNTNQHRYVAQITAASYSASGNVVTLTLATGVYNSSGQWVPGVIPIPWVGTNPVMIANITGSWSPLNGLLTATFISNTSVSVVCAGCSGSSGTPNVEALIGDASVSALAATLGDRVAFEVYKPGRQIHQVLVTRTTDWQDTQGVAGYYGLSTVGSISRSGKYVAYTSNMGSLDYLGPSPYIAATGLDYLAITNVSVQPGETTALFSYKVKTAGLSCSLDLATDSAFQSGVTHPTDAGGALARNIALSGLTAATNYWVRTQCGLDVEATSFRTLAAAGASTRTVTSQIGNPSITGLSRAVPEHRKAGSSTWIAGTPVACASGCTATWTADVGFVNEYHFLWQDSGNATIVPSATYSALVSR